MSKPRLSPLWIMILLGILFGVLIGATYNSWPAQVATHFDLQGKPNAWMSREANLVAFVGLGLGLPLVIYGIFCLTSVFPTQLINLPRREYWLAPERRAATLRELRREALWLGCLIILFIAGLYIITLLANQQNPVHLSSLAVFALLGGFLLGLVIWVVLLLRRFGKAEQNDV